MNEKALSQLKIHAILSKSFILCRERKSRVQKQFFSISRFKFSDTLAQVCRFGYVSRAGTHNVPLDYHCWHTRNKALMTKKRESDCEGGVDDDPQMFLSLEDELEALLEETSDVEVS